MGGGGIVQICQIVTHLNDYASGGPERDDVLTRISSFHFGDATLPVAPVKPLGEADFPLPQGAQLPSTGKIGILLPKNDISIEQFLLRFEGVVYQPMQSTAQNGVRDQLIRTFGERAHERWWGYEVGLPTPTGRFDLASKLRLRVGRNAKFVRRRQLVVMPIVIGFFRQDFDVHHVLALTVLQREAGYAIDTAVRQRQ
jgi:hypothetical protein